MNRLKAIYYIWDYFNSWILLRSRVGKSITNFRELDVSPPLGGKVWVCWHVLFWLPLKELHTRYNNCCQWYELKKLRTALSIGSQWDGSFPLFTLEGKKLTNNAMCFKLVLPISYQFTFIHKTTYRNCHFLWWKPQWQQRKTSEEQCNYHKKKPWNIWMARFL
jgi:hypothetical protein